MDVLDRFDPIGAIVDRDPEVLEVLWNRFGLQWAPPVVVSIEGVISTQDEGFSLKRTIIANDNSKWECYECHSLNALTEIALPNRGGGYVQLWPGTTDSETIDKMIKCWDCDTGLWISSGSILFNEEDWCCIFGAGGSDCGRFCVVGKVALKHIGSLSCCNFVF